MITLCALALPSDRLVLPRITRHEANNPSVLALGSKLYAVYKGVNYNLKVDGWSKMEYGGFRVPFSDSQNYFARVDLGEALALEGVVFLEDRHIRSHRSALNGLQDIRIFHWHDEIYALGAAITHRPSAQAGSSPIKLTSMMLCKITGHTLNPICLLPSRQQYEKNWMPWVKRDELYFVYQNAPYEVLRFSERKIVGSVKPVTHPSLQSYSGSSAVMPFGRNFIGIVHLKQHGHVLDSGQALPLMHYHHRAVVYGPDFEVLAVSPPFTFEGERVEFCCGIALAGDNVVLSYGVWDTQAVLTRMKLKEFLSVLSLDQFEPSS